MYISFIPNGINFTADAYTISLLYPIACRHNAHYITLISFFIVAPPATQILCIYKLCIVVCVGLFIGLVVAVPFRKLNRMIDKSKEKSGIML